MTRRDRTGEPIEEPAQEILVGFGEADTDPAELDDVSDAESAKAHIAAAREALRRRS